MENAQQFSLARKGYDRAQVDRYIQELHAALEQTRSHMAHLDSRILRLSSDLSTARRELEEAERPSYAGLGTRVERLLRSTEAQALDVMTRAQADADALISSAQQRHDSLLASAEAEAFETLTRARMEAAEVTSQAQSHSRTLEDNAGRTSEEMLAAAEREAKRMRADAEAEAAAALSAAHHEAEELRTAVREEMTHLRTQAEEEISVMRGEAERELATKEAEAAAARARAEEDSQARAKERAEAAQTQSAQAEELLTEATNRANELKRRSEEDSQATLAAARTEAHDIVEKARAQAARLKEEAESHSRSIISSAERRVAELNSQRDALKEYIEDIRTLLAEGEQMNLAAIIERADSAPRPDSAATPLSVEIAEEEYLRHKALAGGAHSEEESESLHTGVGTEPHTSAEDPFDTSAPHAELSDIDVSVHALPHSDVSVAEPGSTSEGVSDHSPAVHAKGPEGDHGSDQAKGDTDKE